MERRMEQGDEKEFSAVRESQYGCIEAMPVASAVDGAVLTLRRGRSRSRLPECIGDLRSVGTDYLGVVFNYAEKSDCMRYGSTSKMSVAVQAALEGEEQASLPSGRNPLLGGFNSEDA